jgi:hypothetical protein
MTPENILRDKLRKIETPFAGAATPGGNFGLPLLKQFE